MAYISDHTRLHYGLVARGFQPTDDANHLLGKPCFYQHANGNSAILGKRTALTITTELGTFKATSRDKYFLMQDGDLLYYNGVRNAATSAS